MSLVGWSNPSHIRSCPTGWNGQLCCDSHSDWGRAHSASRILATGCCFWHPSAWYLSFHLPDSRNLVVPWRRNFPSHFQCKSVNHAVDQLQEGLVVSGTTFSRCLDLLGKGVGTWRSVSSAFPHFGQLGFCLEIITYMRQILHPTAIITEISPSPADSSLPADLVLRCSRSILVASPGSLHDRGWRFTSTSSSPVKSRHLVNYIIPTLNQPSPQYSFQLDTVGVKLLHHCPEWRNVYWFEFEALSFHKTQVKIPRISHNNFILNAMKTSSTVL